MTPVAAVLGFSVPEQRGPKLGHRTIRSLHSFPELTLGLTVKTKKHHLEFGNFICKFDDKDLVDHLKEIVLPALMSGETRRYGRSTYHLLNPQIVDLGDNNVGLAFEFVKNQVLQSVQQLDKSRNEVFPVNEWLESAPSSMVLLILNTHRLVFMPKTKFAPTMKELATTCEILINRFRQRFIDAEVKLGERGSKADLRAQMEFEYPRAEVKIVPLTSSFSISGALRQFKVIDKLSITLVATNNDMDLDGFFSGVRQAGDNVGARTTKLEHDAKDAEGLKKGPAAKEVKAATQQGNAQVTVRGKGQDDSPLTQTNDDLKFKQPAAFKPSTDVKENAKEMFAQFTNLISRGIIVAPTFAREARDKVLKIVQTIKRP